MRLRPEIKETSGVSPVIASILLVAITVVLAAVLYVMIANMTYSASPEVVAGTWQKPVIESKTEVTLKFGSFTKNIRWIETKIFIENIDTNETWNVTFQSSEGSHPPLVVTSSSNVTLQINATDVAGNEIISQGDSLKLVWSTADPGRYTVKVLYLETGDLVAMSGGDGVLFTL